MTEKRAIHLFDNPESKIRFLEMVYGDKEWTAKVHVPPYIVQSDRQISRLETQLHKANIRYSKTRDADGYLIYDLHHAGTQPNLLRFFKKHGLTAGVGYSISHPLGAAKELFRGIGDGLEAAKGYVGDPARANGLIFLTAEAFLIMAAGGNKHGKWTDPKNFLQGTAGTLFASQSAAYLFWAKRGDERIASDLAHQLSPTDTAFQPLNWDKLAHKRDLSEREPSSALGKTRKYLEDHPIQTGALLNNAGMLAYISHAVLERRHQQQILQHDPTNHHAQKYISKGFRWGVGGSLVSILGWSALLLEPKEYDGKSSGLGELWGKWRENPQMLTAGTSLASSSLRLVEAIHKKNKPQMIGESIYIPGDILLFFVKNHEYGNSRNGDYSGLITRVAQFMCDLPVVLDEANQQALLEQTAHYLARQSHALDDKLQNTIEEDAQTLLEGLKERCSAHWSQRFEAVCQVAAELVALYPPEQRAEMQARLSQTLSTLPAIHASQSAIAENMQRSLAMAAPPASPPSEEALARACHAVLAALPVSVHAEYALALHDAVTPPKASPAPDTKVQANSHQPEAHARLNEKSDARIAG